MTTETKFLEATQAVMENFISNPKNREQRLEEQREMLHTMISDRLQEIQFGEENEVERDEDVFCSMGMDKDKVMKKFDELIINIKAR